MELNALGVIRNVALECLLKDQICSGRDYGSWGRSTLDYCYLTTNEERWTPGCGSITQTAWALLGLRGLSDICAAEIGRLESAANRADQYVSTYIESFLCSPERDRTKEAKNRHAATALLADILLADLCLERRRPSGRRLDVWEKYTKLLTDLGRYLEETGTEMRASPSTEVALVALYPLLVHTLLHLRKLVSSGREDGTLRALVDVWQEHAVDVVTSAVDLLARFDPKASPVISRPHVWAALLDVMSIVAEEQDEVGVRARSLLREVERDAAIGVATIVDSPLPVVKDGSLWEPWGTLAVLLQLGAKYTAWAAQIADGIVRALETQHSVEAQWPILGGCTHVWSILARRAAPKEASKELLGSAASLATAQRLVPAAKFDYIHWPREERVRIARDLRAFEVHKAWVRGGPIGTPPILRRFAELYRGDPARKVGLTRNPSSRCRSLLFAGYTTSGKSLAAEFLELHAGLGRMVKRLTTATWDPGELWEKHYYNVVAEAAFDERRHELFGVHELRGARFGFLTRDFDGVPDSLIRILSVGWSVKAMADVAKFCRFRGEKPILVALKPSERILELRIRQKWRGENVPEQLREAGEFYGCLPKEVKVIDSSGPKEEMFCELLRILREALTFAEGYDVVISYAGPNRWLSDKIRTVLRAVGVSSFVAGQDCAPANDATAQENIDQLFKLADVIVVIWSREYPMREFSSHEWTHWVVEEWKRNPNRVVFVKVDNTPLPPETRTAVYHKWEDGAETSITDAVKNRLERINPT